MKKDILKIAGVKSEKEFYKKYPTEAAFMKAHKKEFKKAAMGASMVKKQLNQLTDFSNPPQARVGDYIGGEQSAAYKPSNYTELYDAADYANTGSNRKMRMEDQALAAQQKIAANSDKKGGLLGMLGQLAPKLDALSPDSVDSANISTPSADQFASADADMSANFAADMAGGFRHGGYIRKAQSGDFLNQFRPQTASYDKQTKMFNSPTGQVSQADTQALGFTNSGYNTNTFFGNLGAKSEQFGKDIGQGYDKLDKSLEKIGGVPGGLGAVGDIAKDFQQIKEEKNQQRQAHQAFELSGLTKQVAGLTPEIAQRKYNRPEDQAFGTQQMGQSYGAGTNFLAANGARIGGNATEIQNMYNPGDIYSDMGYEPLSDSEIVKQYRRGGLIPKAQFGDAGNAVGSFIGGTKGAPNAGGELGGDIGKTVGKFIPIPGASQALEFVGSATGSIIGAKQAKKTQAWETGAQQNTNDAAFMSGTQGLRNQFDNVMEDGGWVSHDWQPQVITQFGDYDMKDLLRDDPTMDTLRAGGHLKNYTAPSEESMSTERPEMAMGGQLKTTWGGHAEPISYNPYLPGSGETVMFRGKSHEESDGNGHTGIGVKYGEGAQDSYTDYAEYGTQQAGADVEVERGEPAAELTDGETGDVSMVVYGNMPIPSYGAAELGDPKIKGKKFKAYANDLSKMEAKQNKIVEKGTKIVDGIDGDNPFDLLKLNAGHAMVEGANMKLKGLAIQKQRLAGIQNAILDTAEEHGLESDALAKGQIKKAKASDMAKFGGKFTKAQNGLHGLQPWQGNKYGLGKKTASAYSGEEWENIAQEMGFKGKGNLDFQKFLSDNPNVLPYIIQKHKDLYGSDVKFDSKLGAAWQGGIDKYLNRVPMQENPIQRIGDIPVKGQEAPGNVKVTPIGKKPSFLNTLFSEAAPYLRKSNQEKFDYSQTAPEMLALATNQLEPVQAQTFQPYLETPYSVSFQDQMNANQADFNALQRQLGYNPAAASVLAAQKYAANSAILGQQSRVNQEMQMGAFNRNRGVLNDAALKNLAILDTQYQRQSQAKSATKAQAQAALSSIADKIAKHKLENRTLGVYEENMYNYRFGPKGRAINMNAPYEFSTDVYASTGDLIPVKNDKGEITEYRTKNKETAKNGSIVKAIKNL